MITNRRRTRLLFKGCLLVLWLEFAFWTSVLATAPTTNSSGNSLSIKPQSGNQKHFSNVTLPEKNVTTKKVTSQKTTIQTKSTKPPTTKAITFLDDYGELPGISHDYDDDDDDDFNRLASTTTMPTTPETLIHKTKEENLLFEIANPYLEFKQKSNDVEEKNNEAVSTSLIFDSAPKGVNIVPVHRQKRSEDLVPNPVQLAINQLLFTDGGSGETTETEVSTTTITVTSTSTSSAPTTTTELTTSTSSSAPTTTTELTTSTSSSAPTTTTELTTITSTTAAPTTTTVTSTSTTPTTTTTRPQGTTSPPILETKPPNIAPEDAEKKLYFVLVIIISFSNDLNDRSSQMFMDYATEVEEKVDLAYTGCPGYKSKSAKVIGFRRATSTVIFRKYFLPLSSAIEPLKTQQGVYVIEPLQTQESVINSTIADYNVTFDTATVYEQPEDIINYIKENVTQILQSTTIQNYSVRAPENEDLAHTQIKNITSAPCQTLTCDPCYNCQEESYLSGNDTYTKGLCHYGCQLSTQRCTIVDNTQRVWKGECSCKDGYLAVGGSCTDERIVIGVSVGMASLLFLAFVIVFVVLCCRTCRKKKKLVDSDSETSSVNSQMGEQGAPQSPGHYEDATSPISQISRNDQPQRTILPLIVLSAEDEGDENLPPEITQSEAFVNFIPNLGNVADDSKLYTIKRASISETSLHHSQGSNYDNSFF